jgi:hypothetical protein
MLSPHLKPKFERFAKTAVWHNVLLLCLLWNQVPGYATRIEKDSSGVGEILLKVFGEPFAATNMSLLCRQHSEMYLQALSNFTPWAINSKFLFTYVCLK